MAKNTNSNIFSKSTLKQNDLTAITLLKIIAILLGRLKKMMQILLHLKITNKILQLLILTSHMQISSSRFQYLVLLLPIRHTVR